MPREPTACFCGVDLRRAHSITILLFKQPVRAEGCAHWPTATSICVTVSVFVCACVCFLTSPSTPHLLHRFTLNLTPPSPFKSHLLTEWQPTPPHPPPVLKLSTQPVPMPGEVAINPPAGLLAQWVAAERWLTLFMFSSPHTLGSSPRPLPLLATHVYTSAVNEQGKNAATTLEHW